MRTLIINLTRFGDLLQTQPVVHELKASGHTVGVVCLDAFTEAARLLDGVDMLAPLPGGPLLHTLDQDWRLALGVVQQWAENLAHTFRPDQVINLTASLGARLLARRLVGDSGMALHCFGVDAHGFGSNSSLWTSFFEASTRQRGCSPYNIVDVFRKAAGLHTPATGEHQGLQNPEPALQQNAKALLRENVQRLFEKDKTMPGEGLKGYIAFQPGASEARRQWPVDRFAQLGNALVADGYMPVLLGSKAERPLAEAYEKLAPVCIDLIGRTSLPLLAAVLQQTRLLVTNDTGTLHLAAGLRVPSVSLFFATAQPWDTGPYLIDCCCLEPVMDCHPCGFGTSCPHNTRCRTSISAQTVHDLIQARLANGARLAAHPQLAGKEKASSMWGVWPEKHHEVRIWLSRFDQGYMDLVSLSGHERAERTVWLRLQRHFYRQFLDLNDLGTTGATTGATSSHAPSARFTQPPAWLAAALPAAKKASLIRTLHEAQALLLLLENLGILLRTAYSAKRGEQFLATVHRLTALFDASSAFNALGRLWLTASQERGGNLPQVLLLVGTMNQLVQAWKTALEGRSDEEC